MHVAYNTTICDIIDVNKAHLVLLSPGSQGATISRFC